MPNLLQRAQDSHQATLSNLLISPSGKKQWLVVVPIYQKERFRGYVLGHFDAQRSLENMLADIKGLNFAVAIRQDGVLAFRTADATAENENQWAQSLDVPLPGATWQLQVWPLPGAMRDMQSNLAETTLFLSLAAGLLLIAVARFHESLHQARFAGILGISPLKQLFQPMKNKTSRCSTAPPKLFWLRLEMEALGKSLDLLIPERFRAIHHAHIEQFVKSGKSSPLMSDRRHVFGRRSRTAASFICQLQSHDWRSAARNSHCNLQRRDQ